MYSVCENRYISPGYITFHISAHVYSPSGCFAICNLYVRNRYISQVYINISRTRHIYIALTNISQVYINISYTLHLYIALLAVLHYVVCM